MNIPNNNNKKQEPAQPLTPAQAREQLGWGMIQDERKHLNR